MKWLEKLREWENGKVVQYPSEILKPFYFETSFITNKMTEKYREKFIPDLALSRMQQNYTPFINHIRRSKNRYVTSFMSLSKKSVLVVPIPRKGKKFTTLKDFIDNASQLQQREFWKYAAKTVKKLLRKHKKLWVSTHGSGVPYLHLRIESFPIYYQTKKFT